MLPSSSVCNAVNKAQAAAHKIHQKSKRKRFLFFLNILELPKYVIQGTDSTEAMPIMSNELMKTPSRGSKVSLKC